MPHVKLRRAIAASAAVVATAAALPAGAGAVSSSTPMCVYPKTSQVFAGFGDPNQYYLAPGGMFESKLQWAHTSAAQLATPNEPFFLAGAGHKTSVRLPAGATVTSGRFCVSSRLPHLRFVARATGTGPLDVRVDTYDVDGTRIVRSRTTTIDPADHASWAPSAHVSLDTSLMDPGDKAYATVTFASDGSWLVDDVYIDPYTKR